MTEMTVPGVKICRKDPAVVLPRYETPGSAGMDLRAFLREPVALSPLGRARIPTGLIFEIPEGFEGQVRPRSGLAFKRGLTVLNAPGTIDSDYRGEVEVLLVNLGAESVTVLNGDRIAQIVIAPVMRAAVEEAFSVSDTSRGAGGFGSTGAG
jgi:dUTP pyrophosphatase